jgi:hypothetical protein
MEDELGPSMGMARSSVATAFGYQKGRSGLVSTPFDEHHDRGQAHVANQDRS